MRIRGGILGFLLAGVAGCGGGASPDCGNGVVEGMEECDDGNTIQNDGCDNGCVTSTNDVHVRWSLIEADEFAGFTGETCPGVGASRVRFDFTGAEARTEEVQCEFSETFLRDFASGDYHVVAVLVDEAGTALTAGETQADFTVNGDVEVSLNFAFADFLNDYNGNLFFRTRWAGAETCAAAIPPVVEHVLLLERDGQAIPGMTDVGDVIDGSAPGACRDGASSQKVLMAPWGPATMTVTGLDATGTPRFMETFDLFIGAGVANPEYLFDVRSLAPDAGVPDAAVPDAGVPDAAAPDAA